MAQKPIPGPVVFTTSGVGGIIGWIIVHPFNTLAVRMNLASMKGAPVKSFGAFTADLVNSEGFMSLYAGIGAGCLRQVFYATSRLGLFETFRDMAAKYRKTDFVQRFTLASVAGGCAAFISCPVEVCLVRMSNDASLPVAERRGGQRQQPVLPLAQRPSGKRRRRHRKGGGRDQHRRAHRGVEQG